MKNEKRKTEVAKTWGQANFYYSLFDQEKKLTAQKDQMEISLGAFKSLKKGEYDFFIDAKDILTGKEMNIYQ